MLKSSEPQNKMRKGSEVLDLLDACRRRGNNVYLVVGPLRRTRREGMSEEEAAATVGLESRDCIDYWGGESCTGRTK